VSKVHRALAGEAAANTSKPEIEIFTFVTIFSCFEPRLRANVRFGAADFRHRRPKLLVDDVATVPAAKPRVDYSPVAAAARYQPVEVRLSPAIARRAVQPECMSLTPKVAKSGKPRHRQNSSEQAHDRANQPAEHQDNRCQCPDAESSRAFVGIAHVRTSVDLPPDQE